MAVEDSVAQDQLRAFTERIERMEDEKAAIAADIKEIYAEAKGNGFDTKILRKIVTIRKQDANERMEQEAVLELYMGALGMSPAPRDDYEPSRVPDTSGIDPEILATVIEGSKTAAGRKIILDALAVVNAPARPKDSPVARASAIAAEQAADGIDWVRGLKVEPTRHPYSKAFEKLGQDHHVIQDDIEGAKSAPIVVLGDEILDGWARYNSARCTKGIDGESAFFPVVEYEGQDPLIDCIKWNVGGRIMSETDRLTVAQRLTKLEPKRKRDIYAAFELGMELVS